MDHEATPDAQSLLSTAQKDCKRKYKTVEFFVTCSPVHHRKKGLRFDRH